MAKKQITREQKIILRKVFEDKTNSYKMFYLLVMMQELRETNDCVVKLDSLRERIINNIWYPLDVFKLSFGKQDSFTKIHKTIKEYIPIDNSPGAKKPMAQIEERLSASQKKEIFSLVDKVISTYVPFRFLSPFFENQLKGKKDAKKNKIIRELANNSDFAPYSFKGGTIVFRPIWFRHFLDNFFEIEDFIMRRLIAYMIKNNPNGNFSEEKLFKPVKRNLTKYTKAWKGFIFNNNGEKCIYSDLKLEASFSLDHFICWSFFTNDSNWNLCPTFTEINSSKSDRLPSLNEYLDRFLQIQHKFYKYYIAEPNADKSIIEEYCNAFKMNSEQISLLPSGEFSKILGGIIKPMEETAANMSFSKEWMYSADIWKNKPVPA